MILKDAPMNLDVFSEESLKCMCFRFENIIVSVILGTFDYCFQDVFMLGFIFI